GSCIVANNCWPSEYTKMALESPKLELEPKCADLVMISSPRFRGLGTSIMLRCSTHQGARLPPSSVVEPFTLTGLSPTRRNAAAERLTLDSSDRRWSGIPRS